MKRRRFTAAEGEARCDATVTLRDGSSAQCMRRATIDGQCWQHAPCRHGFTTEARCGFCHDERAAAGGSSE
jgi:hypothetical protein